jgi:hypothetical protein
MISMNSPILKVRLTSMLLMVQRLAELVEKPYGIDQLSLHGQQLSLLALKVL